MADTTLAPFRNSKYEHNVSGTEIDVELSITYTNSASVVTEWIKTFCSGASELVIGVDCEWKPCTVRGELPVISVLQLAASEHVLVIHLNELRRRVRAHPCRDIDSLLELLSNPQATFVGMAHGGGYEGEWRNITEAVMAAAGKAMPKRRDGATPVLVDLKTESIARNIRVSGGLGPLAESVLGVLDWKVDKWGGPCMSDWSKAPLTEEQLVYAAMDAWGARQVYLALQTMGEPSPPLQLPTDRPLTMSEFQLALWSIFGAQFDQGEWVAATEIGQAIPRRMWPDGYSSRTRKVYHLAEDAGFDVSFRAGNPYIRGRPGAAEPPDNPIERLLMVLETKGHVTRT